ncbi:MAG: DEAD/DEAH box helicase [Pseudorhodobacter sp.]
MTKFSDLALDPRVLRAVSEAGYETPTPIQAQAIPHALEGKDVLGIAQTGTGKTASFTLPMITILGKGRARARMPRSLVLAPTRELAAQVAENFDIYAKHTKLTKALLIGGVAFGEQDKLIDRGVDVLIATPGRLLDHFERGKLLLNGVQIMVVDEADRMLDMGFIPDIEKIFSLTPFTRQTFFYSATMAPEIERITNTFLSAAVKIEVARQNSTSETIEQALVELTPSRRDRAFSEKRAALRALIETEGEECTNAIIFCNRKMDVDIVAKSLKSHGFNASPIHGDLDQSVRTRTLDGFRDGSVQLLVASDVAARGLDIPSVSHVFNFDVPTHPEDYVHRIGRTGRAGRKGKAITLAVPADGKYVTAIEALVEKEIPRGTLPEGFDPSPRRRRKPEGEEGEGRGRRRGRKDREERTENTPERPEAATTDAPSKKPQREDRRNRRGRDRGEDRVVGMGDHVPDFLLQDFRPIEADEPKARRRKATVEADPEGETP